jgi:hypothetical protein
MSRATLPTSTVVDREYDAGSSARAGRVSNPDPATMAAALNPVMTRLKAE